MKKTKMNLLELIKKSPDIAEGHILEMLGENEELFQERYAICKECPSLINNALGEVCKECGCRIKAKARLEGEKCNLGKWTR